VSERTDVDRLATRITLGASLLGLAIGAGGALEVSAEHRWISGTGGLAITLLLSSLACSPAATLLASRPALAVALRRARRSLGLGATAVAVSHATLGALGYVGGLELGPFLAVAWLRDGLLALLILGALSLTSFPAVTRALRVRAWSALHRLVYAAALFAALHATAAPFGDVGGGLVALGVVALLLVARPLAHVITTRRKAPPTLAD
jgi:sulfoxide reductase heme-binding subunit YedZ